MVSLLNILKLKLSPKTISLVVLIILYSFCYSFLDVFFEDGDDVIMQQIIQGYYTSFPDVHLIFINVIIGYILKPFYTLNSTIYWYSFLLVTLQIISLFIILNHLIEKKISLILHVFFLIFFSYFIIKVQFTSIAGLLSIAGFIFMTKKIEQNNQNYIIPLILFYFSFLIRIEMSFLISFICTIYLLINYETKLINILLKTKIIISFVVFLIIIFSSFYFNFKHYENKEWQIFSEYNDVRKKINDNLLVKDYFETKIKDIKQKSDLELIYGFMPLKNYNSERLKAIKTKIYNSETINSHYIASIKNHLKSKSMYIYYLFLFIIFLIYIKTKEKKYLLLVILFSIIFLYISKDAVFKNRVFMPIILSFFIFNLMEFKNKLSTYFLLPLSMVIIYLNTNNYNFFNKIKPIILPKDKMIVALDYPNFVNNPFNLKIINNQINVYSLGWLSNSPLIKNKLELNSIIINSKHFSPIDDPTLVSNFYYYIENKNTIEKLKTNLFFKKLELIPSNKFKNIFIIKQL